MPTQRILIPGQSRQTNTVASSTEPTRGVPSLLALKMIYDLIYDFQIDLFKDKPKDPICLSLLTLLPATAKDKTRENGATGAMYAVWLPGLWRDSSQAKDKLPRTSPSYGVCQTTEKRVSGLSSFVEQRSCQFFPVKRSSGLLTSVSVSSWCSVVLCSSGTRQPPIRHVRCDSA